MSRLGPLVADPAGSHLDAAAGRGCRFGPAGVELAARGEREVLGWDRVQRLAVGAPPPRRVLRATPAFLVALAAQDLSGTSMRGRTVTVRVGDRWWAGPELDLGRPAEAPYRARDLDALDALLELLTERRRLAALGDPALAAALLDAAGGARHPRLTRRVRTAAGAVLG